MALAMQGDGRVQNIFLLENFFLLASTVCAKPLPSLYNLRYSSFKV